MSDTKPQKTNVNSQSASIDEHFYQYLQSYQKQNDRVHPVFGIAHALARSLTDIQQNDITIKMEPTMTTCAIYAIYARYSSSKQSESSIEDQIRICRKFAADKVIEVAKTYQDKAISGAFMIRSGIKQLMDDAKNRVFDVIIVEAIDRLSRNQSDIALIYQKLEFYGIKILSCNEGEIGEVHIGITGTMNPITFF